MVLKKVFLTGSSGMLGFHFIEELIKNNINFIASSRTKPKYHKIKEWFSWDLNDWKCEKDIYNLIHDVDAIIHVGSIVPQFNQNISSSNLFDINVRSTLCICEYAYSKNIPICYISGSTVYDTKIDNPIKESDIKSENGYGGLYGFSKLLSESILKHFVSKGLKAFIFRPSSIYGFGQSKDKIVPKFLNKAINNEKIIIDPPYNKKYNLVHASDVAKLAIQALKTDEFGIYNIGCAQLYTLEEIAKSCIKIVGSGEVSLKNNTNTSEDLYKIFDLDTSLIKKKFNFHKTLDLDQGLKKTLNYKKINS